MLTGQFRELSDLVGSGVPVKIYKLDNNQTSKVIQVDQFTDPQDIPYPWEDGNWASSFIGYSSSRNQMEAPSLITGPTILYCFYDAEVSLTFKLPLPESQAVTVAYGKGQKPQLRDIIGSSQLVKQAAIDRGISFALPDGTLIDNMRKPVEDATIEVVLCNRERDVLIDTASYFNYNLLHYIISTGDYSNDYPTVVDGDVPIQSVSFHVPRMPSLSVESKTSSTAGSVPSTLGTFKYVYDVRPIPKTAVGKVYFVNNVGRSITYHLIEFPDMYFGQVGAAVGSSTSSTPSTYPSTPSLRSKQSWATPGGETHYGITFNSSLAESKYLPVTLNAELKSFKRSKLVTVAANEIIMSRAPKLQSGTTSDKTLAAWLRSNVHADDQGVARWWLNNYQNTFLSTN